MGKKGGEAKEELAKCGTFSNVPVLDLISGFHAIAKKKKQCRRRGKYVKAVSKALKTVQDDCDYGRRQLQRGCPSQQRTHTHKDTHTQTCSYIHTCKTYKLHLFGLCPFGTFWRINGSPGPLWRVHFQVRVQLKVQLRFQVQCHPMRNAIKTNYQIYVWKRQKTTRQIRNNKTKQKAFIKQLPTLLVF